MSFLYALSGIRKAIKSEFNLRFHIVIANLICLFAYFYGLDNTQWAVLVLTIFAVISAELMNTALENAVDTATNDILPSAKLAKDAAAGSVLVLAVCALIIGFCLFGDAQWINDALYRIFSNMKVLIPCLLVGIVDLLFLFFYKEKN